MPLTNSPSEHRETGAQCWSGTLSNKTRVFASGRGDLCSAESARNTYRGCTWHCTLPAHTDLFPHVAGGGPRVLAIWYSGTPPLDYSDARGWAGELATRPFAVEQVCGSYLHHYPGSFTCTLPAHCLRYPHIAQEIRVPLAIWWDPSLRDHLLSQRLTTLSRQPSIT